MSVLSVIAMLFSINLFIFESHITRALTVCETVSALMGASAVVILDHTRQELLS
jgi:hypothetical protein